MKSIKENCYEKCAPSTIPVILQKMLWSNEIMSGCFNAIWKYPTELHYTVRSFDHSKFLQCPGNQIMHMRSTLQPQSFLSSSRLLSLLGKIIILKKGNKVHNIPSAWVRDIGIVHFKPFFNLTSNASNKETKTRKKHTQTLSNKMEEICVSGKSWSLLTNTDTLLIDLPRNLEDLWKGNLCNPKLFNQ